MNISFLSPMFAWAFVCLSLPALAKSPGSDQLNGAATRDAPSRAESIDEVFVTSAYVHQTAGANERPLHVVSGDDVTNAATQSLGESLDSLLGVASTDYGSGVGQPVIRGMSGDRVKVLNNGMAVRDVSGLGGDHINDIDMNNVQQIEVVRGPSSLLHANGSIGGIINVVDKTIAREDFTTPTFRLGLESQSVNDGDAHHLSYENTVGGLNVSFAYKDSQFDNFDIPSGALLHHEEEHDEGPHHDDEGHEDEGHEDEGHEERQQSLKNLANSDFQSTSKRLGISKTGDWGYFGVSVNTVESLYGIPFHGDEHGDEHGKQESHEGERIFSSTESDVFNLEGAYLFNNRWLKRVNYYFRDSDYSLTEQHAEGEHHQGEEHEGEDHGDGHQAEGPTLFKNIAKEYGAIFDFTHESLAQKVVVNFVEEDVSIIGSEIFMNPTASEELTFGYFMSKDFDLLHVDFGVRYDHINRQGSINHEDEHAGEVERVDQDRNNLSFSFSLGRDISETLELTLGYAQVERAPSVVEMFMNGPHLATGRFEVGNDQLKTEKSKNIDLRLSYERDGLFGSLTLFKNDLQNYVYLMDESGEEHDEHAGEDHGGLILANYVQHDADFEGYELEFGKVFQLKSGELSMSFGRDSVSAEFADGGYLPRMVPEKNIFTLSYQNETLKALLSWKDVERQADLGLNETATDGYSMLDLNIRKSVALSAQVNMSIVVFGNNLLDETSRNHASFVKDRVPLPGENFGIKWLLEF